MKGVVFERLGEAGFVAVKDGAFGGRLEWA
jgi:hypothetical protein